MADQSQSTMLDPGAEAYRKSVYGAAEALPEWQSYGGQTVAGPNAQTLQGYNMMGQQDPRIAGGYGGMANNLGLANQYMQDQMGGGGSFANADMAAYQNPYQQQVIQATQRDYDRMMGQGMRDVGAQATSSGAFGGSRHGLAEAQRMAMLQEAQGGAMAGLRHQGFESAAQKWQNDQNMQMQRAGMASNLGMAGLQGMQGMQQQQAAGLIGGGEYQRGIEQQGMSDQYNQWLMAQQAPYQRLQAQTQVGGAMPYGQVQTQDLGGSKWGGAAGGAMSGAATGAAFGPWGAAAGGLLGGALGWLG